MVIALREITRSSKVTPRQKESWVWSSLARFWEQPLGRVGLGIFLFLILFCFAGPMVYPADPFQMHLISILQPPSPAYPLGTNNLGRNMLARLMLGGQPSLEVGFIAATAAMVIGVVYGMVSGFVGGWVDTLLMRIIDVLRSVPTLFLMVFLDSAFHPSIMLLIVLIAFTSWHGVSRIVRAEILSLKELTYIESATTLGMSRMRILFVHLLPNIMATIVVAATFMVGDSVLIIAGLSFLGLGLPPPEPNWGSMLANAMAYLPQNSWWLIYPPGIAILGTVLSINFLGDALRKAFDVRLNRRG
ncbi:peptide ABC transporter permease [Ferroacidibacillus organovorans]|uniref:Peptide ABC transporter permease n=2 Tax=Ferroacidibacillus organovorans TaxID=1765683 RepID=A0A853KCI5_9BACL|nr:peptide ABC transporter permease [Ferroacidibacillus organovorans]OAG93869.1 peptide ABC transporter permease [Ferroacidibacillus organovorans]